MPQSGKLPVLNLHTGQKSGFSPRRGDSLQRFTSNLAWPTGTWVRLALQNFTSIGAGMGMRPQKISKISTFGKESPHRGEPLDRFLKFYGLFIRSIISILPLAEKLWIGSKKWLTPFRMDNTMQSLGRSNNVRRLYRCDCENMVFVCFLPAGCREAANYRHDSKDNIMTSY